MDASRRGARRRATLAWAIDVGGPEVAEAVRAVAAELRAAAFVDQPLPVEADLAALPGRPGPLERIDTRRAAWTQILDGMLAMILDDATEARPSAVADRLERRRARERRAICGAAPRPPMMRRWFCALSACRIVVLAACAGGENLPESSGFSGGAGRPRKRCLRARPQVSGDSCRPPATATATASSPPT